VLVAQPPQSPREAVVGRGESEVIEGEIDQLGCLGAPSGEGLGLVVDDADIVAPGQPGGAVLDDR
jgi:hypothetical protein